MTKVQKGFLLNEELSRIVEEQQRRTGVSFTKIMTAALLQYYFNDPSGPCNVWMMHAVDLEEDDISVGDMPSCRANDMGSTALAYAEDVEGEPDVKELDPEYVELAMKWKRIAKRDGDDAVQKIIDHWMQSSES